MKKVIMFVIMCVLLTAVNVSATTYLSAYVNRVATTDGKVSVMLNSSTNPSCTWPGNKWISFSPNMDDQVLAVALSAIVSGMSVRLGVETCGAEIEASSFGLNAN